MIQIRSPYIFGATMAFALTVAFGAYKNGGQLATPVSMRPSAYASGKQILLVYIGSEGCKASLKPSFAQMVAAIRKSVSKQAGDGRETFSTLGVSAGNSAELGFAYLQRFGSFDEISAGHGWLNDETMHFVWQTLPGQATVPQIVVVERELNSLQPGYAYSDERVLVRALGVQQIKSWLADGAPIR